MGWPQLGSFSAFIVMVAVMAIQAGARTVRYARHGVPDNALPVALSIIAGAIVDLFAVGSPPAWSAASAAAWA